MTPDQLLAFPTAANAVTQRVLRAKRSYTTRRVPVAALHGLSTSTQQPLRAGDLVLARVDRVGKHGHLESPGGRRVALFVGDEIVVCAGERYAPDQFDASLPYGLGPCHLVAGGGVAGLVRQRHAAVAPATDITLLAVLTGPAGQRVNLADHALHETRDARGPLAGPLVVASLGTSMNAGKTTSAAHLIKGLVRAGLRVGAAKVTGTGSGNDPGLLKDAGAWCVFDFTDAGHASTAGLDTSALVSAATRLLGHLAAAHVDVVVLEVADGLLQPETDALLRSTAFASRLDAVVFSAGEAMGACAGVARLRELHLPVVALAGAMTRSPLARDEAAAATGLPVWTLDQLGDAGHARALWATLGQRRSGLRAA